MWGCGELLDELSGASHPMLIQSLLSTCKWDVHLSSVVMGIDRKGKQSGSRRQQAPSAGLLLLLRATNGAWSGHSAGLGVKSRAEWSVGQGVEGPALRACSRDRVPF